MNKYKQMFPNGERFIKGGYYLYEERENKKGIFY